MLEHGQPHDPTQAGETPAAHVRVSPEELAQALARWQARREGTLTIGEAVQELGLEATPEELLREIRAARAEAARTPSTPAPARRRGVVWLGGAVVAALATSVWLMLPRPTRPTTLLPAVRITPAAPAGTTLHWTDTTLVEDADHGHPLLRTLGELKAGVPALASLTVTADRAAFTDFSNPADAWTLIKHDGHLYVRGWIPAMSAAALRTSPVTLSSAKAVVPLGMTPEPVTVRLDAVSLMPGLSSDDEMVASHLTPDAHFRDAW